MTTPAGPRRAAVLGRPVAHSLSPVLHRAAYADLGLDWTYEAIDCGEDDLAAVLAARAGWAGFSCTMPLKHAILEVAVEVAPLAAAVGSANTLLPHPAGWLADNTDVAGMVAALAEHAVAPRSVTILGAGGTAQAMLAALVALGVESAVVLVRDPARTSGVRATADRLGLTVTVRPLEPGASALGADLVVSTLPRGAADPLARWEWRPDQTVFDVVYDPWPTALAGAASARGARVVSGALMLLHQAAVQVSLMTGREAPVDSMRAALDAAAPGSGL
ncbi:MAG TPA: shikimate dehydrogenase [Jatrophihabitans sp.]|uniref:shikimate dehydrogenase n=1 Tax=Jatrophihabitans sp. TaxID=1932789 RepID=UPI002DFC9ADA|nr:shikimate dehydrogenase [Jatrophihabitans sp.]